MSRAFSLAVPLKGRRGISTPVLLMGVMGGLVFVVMVIDIAQLSIQRRQLQHGADISARSAAASLMDRRWLYIGNSASGASAETHAELLNAIAAQQVEIAFSSAANFAGENRVGGQPIVLENEDVLFGVVDNPTSGVPQLRDPERDEAVNSMMLELSRSKAGGNPPLLWMAHQVGLDHIDVIARAQSCVDTRVHGLRALKHVNVLLMPLALFPSLEEEGNDQHESTSDDTQPSGPLPFTQVWWAKGQSDRHAVDEVENQAVAGEDGIHELTFRLKVANASASASNSQEAAESDLDIRPSAVMGITEDCLDKDTFRRIALTGFNQIDLAPLGGEITTGSSHPPLLPAKFRVDDNDATSFYETLLAIQGLPRIWPVVADCSTALGEPTVGVIGFVAGRLVRCDTEDSGSLIITIQPCLIQTPVALTGKAAQRNPWIGKLLIIR